ncbi:MAG: 16S rRNA (cytidine(1402)-2'-O)-methyltransferase [Patescibacteria group bacterium]|nr:16S rRNA (cytidine(1402)-2'-O)-methyltransferase [Patescibacteria group bacterium]
MTEFFVVATPIGNLEDTSPRAVRVLAEADLILCEDTRVTRNLLAHFKIKIPVESYHQHSKFTKVNHIKEMVRRGKRIALVSDAGTPGVSDPGGKLVEELVREFGAEINIIPVPGPCAAVTLLSASGFPADKFLFLGFPPHKKARQKFFKEVAAEERTVVFYESTHRIIKALAELEETIADRPIVVGRELTKKFETIYRGTAAEIKSRLQAGVSKGEFVIVISSK